MKIRAGKLQDYPDGIVYDGLGWMMGLTRDIKLHFQISPALCGSCLERSRVIINNSLALNQRSNQNKLRMFVTGASPEQSPCDEWPVESTTEIGC